MAYTTKEKIENYMLIEIGNSFDDQIDDWITAVETYINNYTSRDTFEQPAVDSIRYFDGSGSRELIIDEFTSLSAVEILETNGDDVEYSLTEGQDNDYLIYPSNTYPKYKLVLTANSSIAEWYSGNLRMKITGKWAVNTTVPKDIELAATMLMADIIDRGMKDGLVQSESLGDYSVSYKDIGTSEVGMSVKNILNKYKKFTL